MANREGLTGAWSICRDAGLKVPESRDALSKIWAMVFADIDDETLIAAAVAHISDPERGMFWPRPADLIRHANTVRARQQRVRAAIEADAEPAMLLELTDARRTERDARRALEVQRSSIREDRERREKVKGEQEIADGRVFGVEIRRLARHTASALHELGNCEQPRGEHQRWHSGQSMDLCPYRETIERRERSPLRVVGGTDLLSDALENIGDGVA